MAISSDGWMFDVNVRPKAINGICKMRNFSFHSGIGSRGEDIYGEQLKGGNWVSDISQVIEL